MFVDEVEVPEAMDIAGGGVIADGMALIGIGEAGEDVPGRGDGQIQQQSRKGFELAPAPPLAAEQQQRNGRAGKEDRRNEALGERGQRQGDPHDIEARGAARTPCR